MSKSKIALVALVWIVLLTIGVATWKLVVSPAMQEKKADSEEQAAQNELERLTQQTEGDSRYDLTLTLGVDAFSGYAVLRSSAFRDQLTRERIRLKIVDDGADYGQRMDGLEKGTLNMAVFPADALIKASVGRPFLPATIVAVIDETSGADAIVGNKTRYPELDSLNTPGTKFVLVGDSPSETLTQVVMTNFELSEMGDSPYEKVNSPEALMAEYRRSSAGSNEVFVTWEPYVSEILANEAMHRLTDSSEFSGYIVDTLVVNRDFLSKQGDVVDKVLRAYFRALFQYREADEFAAMIAEDAKKSGATLSKEQVAALIEGIRWRTTQDNFTHFGIRTGELQHIEDILLKITDVLKRTNAIQSDPTNGQPTKLFYDRSIKRLDSSAFYPDVNSDESQSGSELRKLSDSQWNRLVPVGTVKVDPLQFARGRASLSGRSERILGELIEKAKSWPRYYLAIRGNASNRGNVEANRGLADKRAVAALEYLTSNGMDRWRIRVEDGEITGETSVTFVVKQMPY